MDKEQFKNAVKEYADKNEDFRLNPDEKHVDRIVAALFSNEEKVGLKLCPCRVRDGTKERDLELICPCNFMIQDVWENKGTCTCGLFVK